MPSEKSYRITLSNNATEKEALSVILQAREDLLIPDLAGRKQILQSLGLPLGYRRTFDMVSVAGHVRESSEVEYSDPDSITLYEVKSTRKRLPDFPRGFFFGATANEFELAARLGSQFQFCFVCLHPDQADENRLSFHELTSLEQLIRTKRTQFQINL